jgi:hypothetical protein
MQGVTILNEFSSIVDRHWTTSTMIGFIITILIVCFCNVLALSYFGDLGYTVIILIVVVFSIFGINSIIYFTTEPVYETHYQVIVDDSTSVVDFLNRYEVLDQQGKIFIVKEKN